MGSGSSSPSSGGSSSSTRNTAGRSKPPISFVVNEEKQGGPESEIASLIQVKAVSFLINENVHNHHTDEYEITQDEKEPKLVVRRGQFFKIRVECDRPYDAAKDKMSLEFDIGERPNQTKRTLIKVDLDGKEEKNKWNAKIESSDDTKLFVNVRPAPNCIVGRWGFHIRVSNRNSKDENTPYAFKVYKEKHKIYILFNPWCKDDTVFLDDEGLLKEYILNDSGKIYFGSKRRISPRTWNFGQFDLVIVDAVLDILDSNMDLTARSNPVKVARRLTAVVNNIGDNGVLVGNWSGKYQGGKSPTEWAGSVAILEQYHATKTPVKYGQCWVFSGVLTTCFRTIGIPARSVTNFASAHDTDTSLTIDKHFDKNRKPMKHLDNDSVWNYHVWNDAWMARPDIDDKDYGGWQACDATPQETSDGVYCCGPFPVKALKTGQVNLPYDGGFIFAEMNADRVEWVQNEEGEFEVKKVTPSSIGFYISTHLPKCKGERKQKGPCSDRRWEDVTSEYKHREGTDEEKAALNSANKYSSVPGEIYGRTDDDSQDVKFEMKQKEDIIYGQPYELELVIENKCGDSRTVEINISLTSLYSAGVPVGLMRPRFTDMTLQGKETKSYKMTMPFEEYEKETVQFCNFRAQCNCTVQETKQIFIEEDDFAMDKPDLEVRMKNGQETCVVDEQVELEATFVNPLPMSLTGCTLTMEGAKQRSRTLSNLGSVGPGETFKETFPWTFTRTGERTVSVVFNSRELEMLSGSVEINVKAG